MKCCWTNLDDQLDVGDSPESCTNEAKWRSCTPFIGVPTCDEHKCRCAKPLATPGDETKCGDEPRHPLRVAGLDPATLAARVADLRYDAMVAFLECLGERFREDAVLDEARGRHRLAKAGRAMHDGIEAARAGAELARDVSSRHFSRAEKEKLS
jgi:hypothetical protein